MLNLKFHGRVALPLRLVLGSIYFLLLVASFSLSWATGQPPNIVLVLTDDQSWNGTSVQMDPNVLGSKSDFYQTPRLEELAAAGMRFTSGYSAAPVCAPTRASLQTGMSPAQLQMTDLHHALPGNFRWQGSYTGFPLTPPAPMKFDPNHFTIPRIIKQANPNYVTAHFGKWHLDVPGSTTPQAVGYDFGQDIIPLPADEVDPWGVFALANLTNSFMTDRVNNSEPFFVQVSHKAVHPPIRSRQVIRDKYAALPPGTVHDSIDYAAMTEDLDTSFGMVLDKITELGIEDNTYVIFVSDNGAPLSLSSSFPLRLGKATVREGGIRVPYIIKGPGIQAGSTSDVPVLTTDLFSTVAELAGHTGPLPSNVEGASLVPILTNGGELPAGMDYLSRNLHEGGEIYFHWPMNFGLNGRTKPSSAVRDGDFKLYMEYGENGGVNQYSLYNLNSDIGETINLATSMPAKRDELIAKLDKYLAAVDASFAFDVKEDVTMQWDASSPGAEADRWRSSIDLQNKSREIWDLGTGTQEPLRQSIAPFQRGLPSDSFAFDGNDVMSRLFFQVGDDGPRKSSNVFTGTPDYDRSASMEFWVRLDSLSQEQILFESGDGTGGISVTLGDADSDGMTNDVRFRVLGLVGPDGGDPNLPLQDLTVTAKIDRFANPQRDFLHVVTVFNDDPNDRYGEIYVNGALAGRVNGLSGAEQSLQWDGYDMAGLGNVSGNGIGGDGGSGDLPFSGGFQGDMSLVRFYNHSLSASTIQDNYNSVLHPVDYGIHSVAGQTNVPVDRPTNVSLNIEEASSLLVVQERSDTLDNVLAVDAIINGPITLNSGNAGILGSLLAGTDFTSYLLQFDPASNNGALIESVIGSITFQQEILAILFDPVSLADSDALLGAIGDYGVQTDRGLLLAGGDFLDISSDSRTLSFDLSIPGDELLQFRVLTDAVLAADFDNSGFVDGLDLAILEAAYGVDAGGDADFDGDTDGTDFLIWQQMVSSGSSASSSASVPEPFSWVLLLGCYVCSLSVRSVRRADRR